MLGTMLGTFVSVQAADLYQEIGGLLVIEAEGYHSKENTTQRDWYTFPTTGTPTPDPDGPHATGTGGGKYVEILPDSRTTHDDLLVIGVNFFETGVNAPRLNYRARITSPGRYYARIRAFSTGTEDNGVHLGVNNSWPLSGTAVQWCDGKNAWTWSGARRVPEDHCGITNGIYLDLTAGDHTIMIGMREDGFEMDRFLLTKDPNYFPTGVGPAVSPVVSSPPPATGKGIGGIGPITGMTATGNAGQITSIDGIPVSELLLGTTTFPNPPKYATLPAVNADNFSLNLVGSGDDQPYVDFWFGQGVMGVYLIENHGNDSGFMQALDASGNPVGPVVAFSTGNYLQTGYRTANGQIASGLFVWMEVAVFGVRMTPPTGGVMGFDAVSVSAIVDEP